METEKNKSRIYYIWNELRNNEFVEGLKIPIKEEHIVENFSAEYSNFFTRNSNKKHIHKRKRLGRVHTR